MLRKIFCVLSLACAVLALAGLSATAGGKRDSPTLAGVWMQTGGEVKMEFADKDVLRIFPHGDSDVIVVICKYTVDKKGRVKATIAELDGKLKDKAKDVLPVGLEFSFQWQVKDDTATLDDMKGEKVERLKSHLEGKYDKK